MAENSTQTNNTTKRRTTRRNTQPQTKSAESNKVEQLATTSDSTKQSTRNSRESGEVNKPQHTKRPTKRSSDQNKKVGQSNGAVKNDPKSVMPPTPTYPWRRIDLHVHTPASQDYEQPEMGYLDILQQAERRGLNLIAFTDHNSANGFRNLKREIAELELLERLKRIRPDELGRLNEFRRLTQKILVLPGFEFTATFGFHILGIFSPDKPLREIENVLVQLRVPSQAIDMGLAEAGATSDVLSAYRLINEAGGLAIAAHANSTNGVSMRDMDFGGQTRIAYTQDSYLHAIEWTDLDRGKRSSSTLLTGIRQEYPRRMHAIQSSDAHRVTVSSANPKRLGVGDRCTEVQLPDLTFLALKQLFQSSDWERVRPVFDVLDIKQEAQKVAAEPLEGVTQAYHIGLGKKANDKFTGLINDVCAFANTQGGEIVLGVEAPVTEDIETYGESVKPSEKVETKKKKSASKFIAKRKMPGIDNAANVASELGDVMHDRIYPEVTGITILKDMIGTVPVLRIAVPVSKDAPHVIDEVFFIRDGIETRPANRDEIVGLIRKLLSSDVIQTKQSGVSPSVTLHQVRQTQNPPSHTTHRRTQSQQRQVPNYAVRDQIRDGAKSDGVRKELPVAPTSARQPLPPRKLENDSLNAVPASATKLVIEADNAKSENVNDVNTSAQAKPSPAPMAPVTPLDMPREVLPRSGVEIAAMEEREGIRYYAVRDLRNGVLARNVTIKSARDLWHYAILKHNSGEYASDKILWQGDRAVLGQAERSGRMRYDVAYRNANGVVYVFYGVITDGLDATWKAMLSASGAVVDEAISPNLDDDMTPENVTIEEFAA